MYSIHRVVVTKNYGPQSFKYLLYDSLWKKFAKFWYKAEMTISMFFRRAWKKMSINYQTWKLDYSCTSDRLLTSCSDPKSLQRTRQNEINHFTNVGKGVINLWLQLGLLISWDSKIGKPKSEGGGGQKELKWRLQSIALFSLFSYTIYYTQQVLYHTNSLKFEKKKENLVS